MRRGFLLLSVVIIAFLGVEFMLHSRPPQRPISRPGTHLAAAQPAPPVNDLTMFRGNPERNLSAVGTVPRHPMLRWRFQTRTKCEGAYEQRGDPKLTASSPWHGLGWTGQPVRVGERVYFGSTDSYVYCLDAASGKPRWYYPNHHCIKGSIAVFGDHIYHGGRDNKIHCYTLDGKMVWETRTGNDMDSNPVVVNGRGYIGAEDDHIYSFDPKTGKILWQSEHTDGSVESSPCVVGNLVIAGSDYGILYACDTRTGKTRWKAHTGGDTDSSAVYWDGRLYVGSKTGKTGETGYVWCFDAKTGKALWHLDMPRGVWATPALNPAKDRLYIGCNNGVLYTLKMSDGSLVWKKKLGNRIWSSAAVTDGCIVVGVRDGRVWCLEEDTGKPLWVFDDGFDIDATPCVANGDIIIGSQDGWVYCIGEGAENEPLNSHWFTATIPMPRRLDHNPKGIVTVKNPAPAPGTYQDTSSHYLKNFHKPVYGPGYTEEK